MPIFYLSSPHGCRCATPLKKKKKASEASTLQYYFFNLIVFSTNIVISGSLGHDLERLGWQHSCSHGNANGEKQALHGTAVSGTDLLGGQRKPETL